MNKNIWKELGVDYAAEHMTTLYKRRENNNYWKQRNKKNNWNKVELEFIMINMLRISFILH